MTRRVIIIVMRLECHEKQFAAVLHTISCPLLILLPFVVLRSVFGCLLLFVQLCIYEAKLGN